MKTSHHKIEKSILIGVSNLFNSSSKLEEVARAERVAEESAILDVSILPQTHSLPLRVLPLF